MPAFAKEPGARLRVKGAITRRCGSVMVPTRRASNKSVMVSSFLSPVLVSLRAHYLLREGAVQASQSDVF